MEFFLRQEHKQINTFSRLNGKQRLKESALILALLSAIFIFVSLFSYDPSDPSWSQTAWNGVVKNAAGSVGAWFADTLFFALGILAYPIPFLLLLSGWFFFRRRDEKTTLNYTIIGTKILGVVSLVLTSAGLAALNFDDFGHFPSGGVVGDVLIHRTMPIFNLLGTTLIFIFIWAAGFTLFSGVSWLTIVDKIGEKTLLIVTKIVNTIRGEKPQIMGGSIDICTFDPMASSLDDSASRKACIDNTHLTQLHANSAHIGRQDAPIIHSKNKLQQVEQGDFTGILQPAPMPKEYMPSAMSPIQVLKDNMMEAKKSQEAEAENTSLPEENTPLPETVKPVRVFKNVYKKPPPSLVAAKTSAPQDISDVTQVEHQEELDLPSTKLNETQVQSRTSKIEMDTHQNEDLTDAIDPFENAEDLTLKTSDLEPEQEINQVVIGNQDGLSELERAQAQLAMDDTPDPFLETIRQAQKNAAGATHPFLLKNETNLPKPTEPLPTLDLLEPPHNTATRATDEELQHLAHLIETRLEDYKITVSVKGIFPGPVITRFELDLAPGVKVSRIMSLSKDIARSLSASAVRIVDVIPGKPYVGLELPNLSRETVFMSEVVASDRFQGAKSPLSVVLGKDIAGEAIVTDLAKAPHMLVAGTTGSGKSVGVNVMIVSMLYKAGPEDVRFIMIDPKMLELSVYEGIPHLLTEVVTDMKDAGNALRWCVAEMERRYKIMSALGVRNIQGYNDKVKEAQDADHPIPDPFWKATDGMDQTPAMLEKLPFIVVIVDEFADLIMVVGKKVEELIARLAQKARAAGIHLVLATQRPSVDVITGLIKANIPTRMAFTVSTKTDSRTILDQGGAESLLGMGDMLFMPNGSNHPVRVHGAFVNDEEVHRVVNNWKARGKPQYITDITHGDQGNDGLLPGEAATGDDGDELDQLFDQVVEFVIDSRRASVSGVQRRFKIGYNRAARIVEQLEAQGIVSAPGHNSNREVLAPPAPKE